MKAELIARPTEYRGIQYRSKCEAMFAMWLDLKYSEDVLIEYEPAWAELGDYVADFAVHRPIWDEHSTGGIPAVNCHLEIIEYKPSAPTVTYCSDVCKKLWKIANAIGSYKRHAIITMNIYYGSVYHTNRGVFLCGPDDFSSLKLNWLGNHEKKIRDYRFDLECEA